MREAPFFDASGNKKNGATIRIGQEIWCLPYAGFLLIDEHLDLVGVYIILLIHFIKTFYFNSLKLGISRPSKSCLFFRRQIFILKILRIGMGLK